MKILSNYVKEQTLQGGYTLRLWIGRHNKRTISIREMGKFQRENVWDVESMYVPMMCNTRGRVRTWWLTSEMRSAIKKKQKTFIWYKIAGLELGSRTIKSYFLTANISQHIIGSYWYLGSFYTMEVPVLSSNWITKFPSPGSGVSPLQDHQTSSETPTSVEIHGPVEIKMWRLNPLSPLWR